MEERKLCGFYYHSPFVFQVAVAYIQKENVTLFERIT